MSLLEINSGSQRKRPSFQLKYLKVHFTLDQEVALSRVITHVHAHSCLYAPRQTGNALGGVAEVGGGVRCGGGCGDFGPFPMDRSQTSESHLITQAVLRS